MSYRKIAGVVVLYNPKPDFLANIGLYSGELDKVYAVDNSEQPDPAIALQLAGISNVVYLPNSANLGIAAALNTGARRALEDDYEYLLTMDQDSVVTPDMIRSLWVCLEDTGVDCIGIVSPFHQLKGDDMSPSTDWSEVEVAMTSGNLLSLAAYQKVGPFRDDYFIDYVDHEYCLRLRNSGFQVIQANRALLRHSLGEMTWRRLLHKRIKLGNHPPIRRYYSFRNRFHLHREYAPRFPGYFRYFYREVFQEILALFFFEKDKFSKLRMMMKGYLDYRNGIFGKYRGGK